MIEMKKIGVIGAGNMATAMVRGMISAINAKNITVSDRDEQNLEEIGKLGVNVTASNTVVAEKSDIIIIAVKPNVYEAVLEEVSDFTDKLYITIAPGLSLSYVSSFFESDVRIIRTMPNMPAQINSGMTVFCPNEFATSDDVEIAEEILSCFGCAMQLGENMLDAAVAVNGSAPAYVFMMIEAMADAAVLSGIPRDKAYVLASQTVSGAAEMVLETKIHPGQLKDMVCSPGGTTIEATAVLEKLGFRAAIMEAMKSCTKKSQKLAK